MPCYTDSPSWYEIQITQIASLLQEVDGQLPVRTSTFQAQIDDMTRQLCAWCQTHDVTTRSLELQIWWRDHQMADARHAQEAWEAAEQQQRRAAALQKLTEDERKALGV